MKVLVTGARGGVGGAVVSGLLRAGHEVSATDLHPPDFETPSEVHYLQADLRDPGQASWVVRGTDAVVHAAAIPDPTHNSPYTVFSTNALAAFNVVEAAVVSDLRRVVYLSSETVLGFQYAEHPTLPTTLPIDESSPTAPQDPYGLSKLLGEHLLAAACARSALVGVSLRPSWVQYPQTYERNLRDFVDDATLPSTNLWSYTDIDDLVDAVVLALTAPLRGHTALFVVNPDSVGGHDVAAVLREHHRHPEVRRSDGGRGDASAIDSARAWDLLGWRPSRSWRDHMRP